VDALIAPYTVNTIPEKTLAAFHDHGKVGALMNADGGDSVKVLGEFAALGVDVAGLAERLQAEGAASFDKSWHSLLKVIEAKAAAIGKA
ncbi:MAG: transaldolase family protein, partial [Cypionkella sp.]